MRVTTIGRSGEPMLSFAVMTAKPLPERNDPVVERAWRELPDTLVGEILDGVLHVHPRPARRHTVAATNLGEELGPPFKRGRGGPGGWVLLDEPEIHLGPGPDIVVPDLGGWRRERMPDVFGGDGAPAHFDLVPDWVCEVLSPRTEARDRGDKLAIYGREGVGNVWFIDPIERTFEVFRRDGALYTLLVVHAGEARIRAEPFEAFELDLAMLWTA